VSQFNDNNVTINLLVNNKQVKPALDESNKDLDRFKDKAENAGDASASSLSGIGDGAQKALGPLSKALGAFTKLTGIIGVATAASAGFVAGLSKLADYLDRVDTRASRLETSLSKYRAALEEASNAEEKTDKQRKEDSVNERFDKLRTELGPITQNIESDAEVVRLFAELESARQAALRKIDDDIRRKREEQSRLELESLLGKQSVDQQEKKKEVALSLAKETASEEEQIEIEKNERIRSIREAFNRQDEVDRRDALIRQAEVNASVKIGELRKKEQDDIDSRHERVMEQIQQRREAELQAIQSIRDAYRQLAEEQTRGLGFNQSSGLGVTGNSTELFNSLIRRAGR